MINIITILNIGFSVLSAVVLFSAYTFFLKNVNRSWFGMLSCGGLLGSLVMLQLGHLDFLLNTTDVLVSNRYRFWLFLAPPMFYFFSRATLLNETHPSPLQLLHLLPVSLNYLLPMNTAIPLIFLFGMGYSFWLAHLIYGLRAHRKRFKFEIFFFTLFSLTAVFVLIMGIAIAYIDNRYFYLFYANSIAIAFILIVAALVAFPELLMDLAEVAKLSYAASTLGDVDVDSKCRQLEELMLDAKMYQNENLNLNMVAEAMQLSVHQLSELVNVRFAMNFSRYIREQRVAAAKQLLINEPDSSVLAIGLDTGFKSQSNFYAAFKEITGMSPGAYRKSQS